MKRFSTSILLLVALSIPLAFQNCTGMTDLVTNSPLALNESQSPGGNGEGYDGKIYNLILASGICADGDAVAARILIRNGVALMIRQNCRDLGDGERFEVPLVFRDAEKRILVYEGQEYLLQYVQFQEMKSTGAASLVAGGMVWNAGPQHLPALAQLNDQGRPSWIQSYDHEFTSRTLLISSVDARADGLSLTASAVDFNLSTALQSKETALIANLDQDGKPRWARVYGSELPARHKLRFVRVQSLSAGRSLVGASLTVFSEGATLASGATPERMAAGLLWLDAEGHIEKQKWFEGLLLTDVLASNAGEWILSGRRDGRPILVKVDTDGDILWSRQVDIQADTVLALGDGGLLLAGSTDGSRAVIARIDGSGNLSWSRSYGTATETGMSAIASLVARPEGGYYAFGFADRPQRTATYFRIDENGSLVEHAELRPGYAARWKKAVILGNGSLWGSLVDSDFRRVENSLNEVLVRVNPGQNPPCSGCVRNESAVATAIDLSITAPTFDAGPTTLNRDFRETTLRPRSLGYPLFISP